MDTSSIRTHQINYGNRPNAVRRVASNPAEYQEWHKQQLELNKLSLDENEAEEIVERIPEVQEAEETEANFLEDTEWVAKWFE